jgi:hypothetical protein
MGNRAAVIQALREQSGISTATRRAAQLIRPFAFCGQERQGSNGECCRICLVDVDTERPRQGPQADRFRVVGPAVVKRQDGLGTPHGDASLERADLTIRELAGIALLQLVEN